MQKTKNIKPIKVQQLPHGRGPSYAEDIKSVQSHYNQIKASKQYDEEKIRFILAEKFYKPVEIIDEYLCFGEYLNDSALNALAKSKMGKRFFELMQRVKRNLIKNYRHEELTDQKITAKISKAVKQMHSEYRETDRLNTKDWQRFYESGTKPQNKLDHFTHHKCRPRKPQTFKYWSGTEEPHIIQAVDVDDINKELKEVTRELRNINVSEGTNLRHKAVKIKKIMLCLAKVHNNVLELDRIEVSTEQREAA